MQIKVGIEGLRQLLLCSCALCATWRTLLKGVNEVLLCFLHFFFCPPGIKFGVGGVHKTLLGDFWFWEIRRCERHALLWDVNGLLSVLSAFSAQLFRSQFGTKDLHVKLFSSCEFTENRRTQGRTSRMV